MVNNRPVRGRRLDWIKWALWVVWIAAIAAAAIAAGGYRQVQPLYLTESGISIDRPQGWIIYYAVVILFFVLSAAVGRRALCHTVCWMAPFMIIGRKLRNVFAWPALRLVAETEKCANCQTCTRNCPMSLDVNAMVQQGQMENAECILCGSCVDGCSKDAIRFSFSRGK